MPHPPPVVWLGPALNAALWSSLEDGLPVTVLPCPWPEEWQQQEQCQLWWWQCVESGGFHFEDWGRPLLGSSLKLLVLEDYFPASWVC